MAATTEDRAYSGLPNKAVSAADGIDYAYRDTGGEADGTLPLVLFQHFRGNLDSWDPALIDGLRRPGGHADPASDRPADCWPPRRRKAQPACTAGTLR